MKNRFMFYRIFMFSSLYCLKEVDEMCINKLNTIQYLISFKLPTIFACFSSYLFTEEEDECEEKR